MTVRAVSLTMEEREIITALNRIDADNTVVLDPPYLDEAIIGISQDDKVIYSFEELVRARMKHEGCEYQAAVDDIYHNTIDSLPTMGEYAPIILFEIDSLNK